jgi:hypothetical protein
VWRIEFVSIMDPINGTSGWNQGRALVTNCIRQHETVHQHSGELPACPPTGITRLRSTWTDVAQSECPAYAAELNCLSAALNTCNTLATPVDIAECKNQVQASMRTACMRLSSLGCAAQYQRPACNQFMNPFDPAHPFGPPELQPPIHTEPLPPMTFPLFPGLGGEGLGTTN